MVKQRIRTQKENVIATATAIGALFSKGKPIDDYFRSLDEAVKKASDHLAEEDRLEPPGSRSPKRQTQVRHTLRELSKLSVIMRPN